MRLKNILKEQKDKNQALEELDQYYQSGNWQFNFDVAIYRGTKTQSEYFKVKDTIPRQGTRDTDDAVDQIIHEFYQECYPKLPDRRNSRFGATSFSSVQTYAKQDGRSTFVVVPHESAKITYTEWDPYSILQGIEERAKRVVNFLLRNEMTRDVVKERSDFLYSYYKSLESRLNTGSDFEPITRFGCPKDQEKKINKELDDLGEDISQNFKDDFELYIDNIVMYFNRIKYNQGYPDDKRVYGEVMWSGKYLQIQETFYEEFVYYKTGK